MGDFDRPVRLVDPDGTERWACRYCAKKVVRWGSSLRLPAVYDTRAELDAHHTETHQHTTRTDTLIAP